MLGPLKVAALPKNFVGINLILLVWAKQNGLQMWKSKTQFSTQVNLEAPTIAKSYVMDFEER